MDFWESAFFAKIEAVFGDFCVFPEMRFMAGKMFEVIKHKRDVLFCVCATIVTPNSDLAKCATTCGVVAHKYAKYNHIILLMVL